MLASQLSTARAPEISAPRSTVSACQNSSPPAIAIPSPAQTAAMIRVTSGPATAILNSVPAESVSRVIRATPPNSHSVMSEIGIPLRTATTAWPSSWSRIEPKKASAVTTAST